MRRSLRPFRCAAAIAMAVLTVLALIEESSRAADAQPAPVPPFRQAQKVAILVIEGEVDMVTMHSMERRLKSAREWGADAVVIELNTPGGDMLATLDICSMLKDSSVTPPNRVAWVHPKAYSAGTIMALACREILVSPNATFGDAAPIQVAPGMGLMPLPEAERAKIESPLLEEVIDSARRNHYDENLVQAFVSVGIELWVIEHKDTGQRVIVGRDEYRAVFGEDPPDQIVSITPATTGGAIAPQFNTLFGERDRAREMTPEELESYKKDLETERLKQQTLPPSRAPLTEADQGEWTLLTQVISGDRLLTVKSNEALFYGLATRTIANDAELAAFFGTDVSNLKRFDRSWSEGLVRALTNPWVRGVLIAIFLIALFLELAAPGLGMFGAAALVSLLILIGAPYLAGMAQWWDILLIVVGLLLIAMEIFVIPGFGVSGVAGALCLLVGLVGTFISGDISSAKGQDQLTTGIVSVITAIFAGGVGIWLISRQVHSIPVLNRLMLHAEVGSRDGATVSTSAGLLESMGGGQRALAVGDLGVAETDLRPAGRACFENRLVDVQSPGRFIEKGTSVRVISVGRYVIEVEDAST